MAGGRPTKYKPEYCQKLIDIMSEGFSYEAAAAKIGVNKTTLYEWEKHFEEFSNAKEQAFEMNRVFWESAGIEGLWNEKDERQLNNTVWVFNMKNRFGWRDKVEHSGDQENPIGMKLFCPTEKPDGEE